MRSYVSRFHRLLSDELWYYHYGDPLEIHMLHEDGGYGRAVLGTAVHEGQLPQVVVPKMTHFGAKPVSRGKVGWVHGVAGFPF